MRASGLVWSAPWNVRAGVADEVLSDRATGVVASSTLCTIAIVRAELADDVAGPAMV